MSRYTKEQLLEAYNKLPKALQDAIISVDSAKIIREIGEKHKLMLDNVGELADETGLVMLGFTSPNQFIPNLAQRLNIDRNLAKEIAEEINSQVFFPVREQLKKIYGIDEAPMPAEEKLAPTPPPLKPAPEITKPSFEQKAPEPKLAPQPNLPNAVKSGPPENLPISPTSLASKESAPILRPQSAPGVEAPTPPKTDIKGIFEAKTKTEVFRQPMETTEKIVDPYREQTI